MKLFSVRGGIHPEDRKALSAGCSISDLPLPALLHIPVQQHIGAAAQPVVQIGQAVRKGELLAHSQGAISAPVHAPTSGHIVEIGAFPAHHPSGLPVHTVTLRPDGEDRWRDDLEPSDDPFALAPEEVSARVARAGVVGMGGATFPSAVKLNLGKRYALHTLIINGAECEPYLTCDDRLMREQAEQLVDGIRIMAHALGVPRVLIAIENNKPDAQRSMRAASLQFDGFEVLGLPTRYPMGSEKHLALALTGLETPARGLTADIGVVVHNVATALAVHQALRHGWPLISRTVTVSGAAIREPANLRVPIGTPVQALLDYCGGTKEEPARLISGGPMMGQALPGMDVPVVKGSNAVLALSEAEATSGEQSACIRCARCVSVCPCGLVPVEMAARVRGDDLEGALQLGVMDCVGCGCCSYVCPANIPLVHYFNHGKGELGSRQRTRNKLRETARLAELRRARLEAIKQKKRAALAARKRDKAQTRSAGESAESGS